MHINEARGNVDRLHTFVIRFSISVTETRIEERLIRLQQKHSTNRSTQVEEPFPLEQILLEDKPHISSTDSRSIVLIKEEHHKTNWDITSRRLIETPIENSNLEYLDTMCRNNIKIDGFDNISEISQEINNINSSRNELLDNQNDDDIKKMMTDLIEDILKNLN